MLTTSSMSVACSGPPRTTLSSLRLYLCLRDNVDHENVLKIALIGSYFERKSGVTLAVMSRRGWPNPRRTPFLFVKSKIINNPDTKKYRISKPYGYIRWKRLGRSCHLTMKLQKEPVRNIPVSFMRCCLQLSVWSFPLLYDLWRKNTKVREEEILQICLILKLVKVVIVVP